MWQRNVFMITVCIGGFGAIAVSLWPDNRIQDPLDFNPQRAQTANFSHVISDVEKEFQENWSAAGLQHTRRAPDLTIARRLSLGLTGTVPSLEEIRAFEACQS